MATPLYQTLLDKIARNDFSAGIIGLGYVGLPLAMSMAKKNVKVIGFDIDPAKCKSLNGGASYLETVKSAEVTDARSKKVFEATSDMNRLTEVDFIVICVPTPLDQYKVPDLSYIESSSRDIAATLRKGQVVSLESTTYPGTMDDIVKPILAKAGLILDQDYMVIYSPEREDPGNRDFKTSTIPKVVGADTPESLEIAQKFYGCFIDSIVPVRNIKTAEAVKITENIFRAVNIAMVNELKVIYDRMGIDIWEVIDAAKTKPFGYMPFYPGPGLGGHCIPIDPFYLSWKAREFDTPTRFIELAGEINVAMPRYVLEKTIHALNAVHKRGLAGAKILMCGIAYKKNVNDQRESPAFPLLQMIEEYGASVDFFDPHIDAITPMRHFSKITGRRSVKIDAKNIAEYDAVLIITDHDNLPYDVIAKNAKLIVDTRNAMKPYNVDPAKLFKA